MLNVCLSALFITLTFENYERPSPRNGHELLEVLATIPSKFSKAIVAKLDELDFVSFADPRPRSREEENWYKLAFEEAFYPPSLIVF